MVIGITPSLPFKGVHLLLGNDLAGDKVVVNPLVTDTPNIGQTDEPIKQEIPDLYPSCAVTRAMAKRAILKNSNSDIDLPDTFIGQCFNNEIKKYLDPSLSDTQNRLVNVLSFTTKVYCPRSRHAVKVTAYPGTAN